MSSRTPDAPLGIQERSAGRHFKAVFPAQAIGGYISTSTLRPGRVDEGWYVS
ncbi:hypothetical protein [Streptomyces sp. NPDC002889]|uniref:hypothetical protein n=1 Tax=Streptomyces sp. NPDC002889 TaxID=3364669 RepID=UPI0036939935